LDEIVLHLPREWVVGDDGLVGVPVPLVPDAEKLYDGTRLYADISIQEVLPRKVLRSYAAT